MEETADEFKKRMIGLIYYKDKLGNVIDVETWEQLHNNHDYRIIKQEQIGKYFISTIWLGTPHCDLKNPNIIEGFHAYFETMVFWDEETESFRYDTLEEAKKGHEEVVKEYKEKKDA